MTKLINILLNRAVERLISLVSYPDLFKGVADRLPLDGIVERISYERFSDTVSLDYTLLAQELKREDSLNYETLGLNLDYATLVESLPQGFDYEQVARNIDARELVEYFTFTERQCQAMMTNFDYGKLDYSDISRSLNYMDLAREIDYARIFASMDTTVVVKKATEEIIDQLDMTVFARDVGAHFGEDAYRHVVALLDYRTIANLLAEEHGVPDMATLVKDAVCAHLDGLGITKSAVEENVSAHLASLGITKDGTPVEKGYREMVIRDEVKKALAENSLVDDLFKTAKPRTIVETVIDDAAKGNPGLLNQLLDRAAALLLDRAAAAAERGEVL